MFCELSIILEKFYKLFSFQFVGRNFGVYIGREFVDFEILPEMIGLYFGELAPTRTSPTHTGPGVGATKSSKFMPLK